MYLLKKEYTPVFFNKIVMWQELWCVVCVCGEISMIAAVKCGLTGLI